MSKEKNKTEVRNASALMRLVRLSKPGTVGVMQPIARCVEQIQEKFDLPTDDKSTVELALIINDWYREETRKTAEVITKLGD